MRRLLVFLALLSLLLVSCAAPPASPPRPMAGISATTVQPPPDDAALQGDHEAVTLTAVAGTKVHCGYERWAIKTGTDKDAGKINLTPVGSSVASEVALKSPWPPITGKYPPQPARFALEEQTVTIPATLVEYHIEQDNDFHLVLSDGTHTMIAEIPNPLCVKPTSPLKAGISSARTAFVARTHYKVPAPPPSSKKGTPFVTCNCPVTVTGVRFFDDVHGQTGVAPNGVEVHPVLSIVFTGSKP